MRKTLAQRRIQFKQRKNRLILPRFASNAIIMNKERAGWREILQDEPSIFADTNGTFPTGECARNIFVDQPCTLGIDSTREDEIFCLAGCDADEDPDGLGFMRL